jgi:hypothetical protein
VTTAVGSASSATTSWQMLVLRHADHAAGGIGHCPLCGRFRRMLATRDSTLQACRGCAEACYSMGFAYASTLAVDQSFTTLEIKINLL